MSSVERRERGGKVVWRAHFRDPAGKQCNRTFARREDAQRYLIGVEQSKLSGSYVDPARGRVTVEQWAEQWLATKLDVKPSTHERYAGIVRTHVVPRWGSTRLADISHAAVQAWVARLARTSAPASVAKTHRVFSQILGLAVRDGRLVRNPADGISLPRVVTTERRYVTHSQVRALSEACGANGIVVLFLSYTGVRFGELAALRVGRLDLLRRRATIAESVTEVRGEQVWGTPKGHEHREVPIPRFLCEELGQHVAGKGREELVFTSPRGGARRVGNFRRDTFDRAAEEIGLAGLHPHELRHCPSIC
jgi:integrase